MHRQRHRAPAAADVEHALPGLEVELGRDMRLLVALRLFQAVARVGEVSAAVIAVGVEEQLVQFVVEVIMVRDVLARRSGVVAAEARAELAHHALLERAAMPAILEPAVADDQLDQFEHRPLIEAQAAVHIGLTDHQPRVTHQVEQHLAIVHPQDDLGLPRSAAIDGQFARMVDHAQAVGRKQAVDEVGDHAHGVRE